MTIKETMMHQMRHADEHIYLLSQGAFYHAYNEGAEHLHAVTNYKVRDIRQGTMLGFPISSLPSVLIRLQKFYPQRFVSAEQWHESHIKITIQ